MIELEYREGDRTVHVHLDDTHYVLTAEQATSFPIATNRLFLEDLQSINDEDAGIWTTYFESPIDEQCEACESDAQWNAITEDTDAERVQTIVLCFDCVEKLRDKLEKGNEENSGMLIGDNL